MEDNSFKYKLVDINKDIRVDGITYFLTKKEADALNYAYGLNGVSKRMVLLGELSEKKV